MGWLDEILRRQSENRRRRRVAPKTAAEGFWINLIKAFGKAVGGKFGRALQGPRRRRRRRYW
ncbi:MAG: hypothetical protein R3D57_05370 [Hyphomicrobiaceae bacterium]